MAWTNLLTKLSRPPLWVTLLICAAVLGARRPDVFQSPQFWAEDGIVFFMQARLWGAEALLEPSAGYLHTVLRIVAWIAAWFDPTLAPALYIAAAGALTLYVAARTQSARFPLPPSIGYALAVVLVPDAREILLTLTNVQWVLAAGLVLVLIAREPETIGQRVHDGVAVLLLGLTGPFIVPLLPLFGWKAVERRTRFSFVVAGIAAVAAAVQLGLIYRSGINDTDGSIAYRLLLAIPGVRLGGSLLSGGYWRADIGVGWATVLGLITLGGVAWLAVKRGPARAERGYLGLAFAGLLTIALYRCRHLLPDIYHGHGPRYFFPLYIIVLWLGLATSLTLRGWAARAGWSALGLSVALNLPRLHEWPFQDFNWPEYAARIRRGERVTVRVNPNWEFTVPGRDEHAPVEFGPEGLVNVSMRGRVQPERPLIMGFVLRTKTPRALLIRAVGPSLAGFGITNPLPRPRLTLLRNGVADTGFQAETNGVGDPAMDATRERCDAFPLQEGSADRAGMVTLTSGLYSVVVETQDDAAGEVLVEIYDVPPRPER